MPILINRTDSEISRHAGDLSPSSRGNELIKPAAVAERAEQLVVAPKTWKEPSTHAMKVLKDPWYRKLFTLQNALYHSTVDFFHNQEGFAYVLTPLTTDTISSPMGLGSDSLPVQVPLFGDQVYLADSMQFVLEYFLRLEDGLPGTYYVSSSFRGEDPDSTHLNQFYHVECEVLGGVDVAIATAEGYLRSICGAVLASDRTRALVEEIAGSVEHVEEMLAALSKDDKASLPQITVDDAIALFEQGKHGPIDELVELAVEGEPQFGRKLTRKAEQALIAHFGGTGVWLTEMDHLSVPFYQAYVDEGTKKKALCADLLMGLGETLGLGERHATAEEARAALAHHTVPEESYGWYVEMREVAPLKTSGWGMGLERFVCWLLKHDDVRDLHIIPRLKGERFLP